MRNPAIEALTDAASYETLQKENPRLLTAIEKCVTEGETAKSIERRMRQSYGRNNLIALLVAGAAHHLEYLKNAPKS